MSLSHTTSCTFATGLILGATLLLVNYIARADCVQDAQIVEQISEMSSVQRESLRLNTIKYGSRDARMDQVVMQAIAWAEAGIDPKEMWAKCESF